MPPPRTAALPAPQAAGYPGDVTSYTAAICACNGLGQWQHAQQLVEDMEACGMPVSDRAFTAAIQACERAEEWEAALGLWQRSLGGDCTAGTGDGQGKEMAGEVEGGAGDGQGKEMAGEVEGGAGDGPP